MKRALTVGLAVLVLGQSSLLRGANLEVRILPLFNNAPLIFDTVTNQTAVGQKISVTRLDFLMSGIALRRADGAWIEQTNCFAYISARNGRTSFALQNVPGGRFDRLRFHIGLMPKINHADVAKWPAGHPLNPEV